MRGMPSSRQAVFTMRSIFLRSALLSSGLSAGFLNNARHLLLGVRLTNQGGVVVIGLVGSDFGPDKSRLVKVPGHHLGRLAVTFVQAEEKERVILVGIDSSGESAFLEELEELARTAGAETVGKLVQSREAPHPGTYLGLGKLEELKALAAAKDATGVICDDELSPAQLKNMEQLLELKVMDRTLVILDIFAARAATREGKIQVELAQLKYRAARLVGLRDSLSRLRYDAGGCFSDHRRSFRQPKGKSVPSSSDRLAPHLYLGALLEKPARPSFFRLYRRSDSFYGTLLSLSDGCIFSQ